MARGWRGTWPRSVRVRTTSIAVLVVAVALGLGAFGLVATLRASLSDQLTTTAELRAQDVANTLESGRNPADLAERDDDEDEEFVQVIDAQGHVVGASPNIVGQGPAIGDLEDLEDGDLEIIPDPTDDDHHAFVVATARAEVDGHDYLVLVGRSMDIVATSTDSVATVLTVGIPVLVALVGLTTWLIVGRTLAPVEAIRREVDAISSDELHRRVPEPDSRDEIARLAATMNRMLGRLDAAQTRQRRFISDASHELRSPVSAIRQHAEVALAHPYSTTLAEFAEVVRSEDLRVQQLVEDLLFLARSDEGTNPAVRRAVDLDDLVFAEARRLRDAGTHRVDSSGVTAVRVSGDPARLARMLRNLGDNANRHASSTIRLSLREEAGKAVCRVEDDGVGIPTADRERIFERFVRLDDARARDDGGSGLGLAIVAEIVASHTGSITVTESALGGACTEVRLPATREG